MSGLAGMSSSNLWYRCWLEFRALVETRSLWTKQGLLQAMDKIESEQAAREDTK